MEVHDLTSSPEQTTPTPKKKPRKRKTESVDGGAQPTKQKKQKAQKPQKEARLDNTGRRAVFRKTASTAVLERIARTLPGSGHRLFLLGRRALPTSESAPAAEEFTVLGATANVYNVTIGSSPSCSCPDAGKGNVCKHQLFVMLRVLHMDSKDPVIWQRGLLAEEVQHIWETSEQRSNSGALHTSVTANRALQAAYAASQADTAGSAAGSGAPSRPVAGDCPICYDDMQADKKAPSEVVTSCKLCGNHVHKECFQRWCSAKRAQHVPVTCVYCRAAWDDDSKEAPGSSSAAYLNLAQHSAQHRGSATSLQNLYGDRSLFIRANQGSLSRAEAIRQFTLA